MIALTILLVVLLPEQGPLVLTGGMVGVCAAIWGAVRLQALLRCRATETLPDETCRPPSSSAAAPAASAPMIPACPP